MEQEIRSSSLPLQLQLFCLQAYTKLHYVPGLHTPFLSRFLRIRQFGCSLKSLRLFSHRPQSCLLCHPNFLSSSSVSPIRLLFLIPPPSSFSFSLCYMGCHSPLRVWLACYVSQASGRFQFLALLLKCASLLKSQQAPKLLVPFIHLPSQE